MPDELSDIDELEEVLSRDRSLVTFHRVMLSLSIGICTLALLLRARSDQRVEFLFAPGIPLPESCQSRALLKIDCPGCGLTRSFIALAQGNLTASRAYHRLGWLVASLVVLQIPYRLAALRHRRGAPLGTSLPWGICGVVGILLVVDWLVRMTIG